MDFYRPLALRRNPDRPESHFLGIARWATVVWAVLLFIVGLIARHWGSVLEAGLSIASILYGSLLGVFLLGLLTRRVGESAAMCGMSVGFVLLLFIKFWTPIAFTWYVLIGSAATFGTALAASLILKENRTRAES